MGQEWAGGFPSLLPHPVFWKDGVAGVGGVRSGGQGRRSHARSQLRIGAQHMQRPRGKNEWVAGADYSQPSLGMGANSRQLESR